MVGSGYGARVVTGRNRSGPPAHGIGRGRVSELDEAWVEEAIARHRWYERLLAELPGWASRTEVSIHSPDQLVEVRVTADGTVRQVDLVGPLHGRTTAEVSRSVQQALSGATEAAGWARRILYAEALGRFPEAAPAAAPPTAPPAAPDGQPAPPDRPDRPGQSGGATTTGSSASRGRSEPGRAGTTQEESGLGASGSTRQRRQIRSTPIG